MTVQPSTHRTIFWQILEAVKIKNCEIPTNAGISLVNIVKI